jgi:hypothetical protein
MKSFLLKLAAFSIPFVIIAVFFIVIDPYNYFFESNFIDNQYKILSINRSVKSMPRGNMLWKIIDFKRHPEKNIIIGDSRSFGIDERKIENITGEKYYNFSVPGGNYNSLFKTFWYVNQYTQPEKVYLQVGFHNYNLTRDNDLFAQAQKANMNPLHFEVELKYTCDAFYTLLYKLTDKQPVEFSLDKEAFEKNWNIVLKKQVRMALNHYIYPEEYKAELQKIARYCKSNNIELYFIIFPSHEDFHKIIEEKKLEKEYATFLNDINGLGKTYNFEHTNDLTTNKSNYQDVYHLRKDILNKIIITDIWGNKQHYSTKNF